MRISKNLRNRRLFKEAFKAGYKKALNEARQQRYKLNETVELAKLTPEQQEIADTFIAAAEEAEDEGVTDIEGILDHWQQLYADDVLYGDNPMQLWELGGICVHAFVSAGIFSGLNRRGMLKKNREITGILRSYADMRNDFNSRF